MVPVEKIPEEYWVVRYVVPEKRDVCGTWLLNLQKPIDLS
jgi:hypothetical protein